MGGSRETTVILAGALAMCGCSFAVDTSDLSSGPSDAGDASLVDALADSSPDAALDEGSTDAPDSTLDAAGDALADSTLDASGDSAAIDAADTSSNDAPTVACKGTAGPTAVPIDGKFCIDRTEVTNAQYSLFLAAAVPTTGQPAVCGWNTSYVPTAGWPAAAGRDAYPVGDVDWCDARAYCAWAGKRLCGKVGGGTAPYAAYLSGELYYACSANATKTYPYGNTFNAAACGVNGSIQAVATYACEGGFPGVFDLGGNVAEWQDFCDGTLGAADDCREGTWPSGEGTTAQSQCDTDNFDVRQHNEDGVGIRCCSDVAP